MLTPFFTLAAQSPGRQRAFRQAVLLHLGLLTAGAWVVAVPRPAEAAPWLGHLLLVAGIVEGAMLLGWRLAQLPKSRSLEFLLVSPLRSHWVFTAEALVGLARLALVTLSGLPVLALLTASGALDPTAMVLALVMPWTWGALTGLGLTVWAYESRPVRRWGERVMLLLILSYLVIGVLAGEHLQEWLSGLPGAWQWAALDAVRGLQEYNPFALLGHWMRGDPWVSGAWTLGLQLAAAAAVVLLLARAACRLRGHFEDRHYQRARDRHAGRRTPVGDRPLAWWAVRRVSEYAGRINVWLAGGFSIVYALYVLAGPHWPTWLGQRVFQIVDASGGIPAVAAGLVVLAAVPAAFQYGLWDPSAHDRCRRLELLLLTRLDGRDFWEAAAAAAWRRGRSYFGLAMLLWAAAAAAGRISPLQAVAAAAGGVLLWGSYFALGFRAFARGTQANRLGTLLTLGLPLAALVLFMAGRPELGRLLPPGGVYGAAVAPPALALLPGAALAAAVALLVARLGPARCVADLRGWYESHHGRKVMD